MLVVVIPNQYKDLSSVSDHLFSKTGLLFRFHCRTFLTEITESKAAEDEVFLTPVSHIYFVVLVYF